MKQKIINLGKDIELAAPAEVHMPSIEECIKSMECLFKAYQKDSEFNYQLSNNKSPWNILKLHILELKLRNATNSPRKITLCGTGPCSEEEKEAVLKKIKELNGLKKEHLE